MAQLEAISGRHAVQSATLKITLKGEKKIPTSAFSKEAGSELRKRLGHLFTGIGPVKALAIQIGGASQGPMNETLEGFVLSKPAKPEAAIQGIPFSRSLQVTSSQVIVQEFLYDRWKGFRDLVDEALAASLEMACAKEQSLDGVTLQYVDAFVWRGYRHQATAHTVFAEESEFLTKAIFGMGADYWHVHQGFYRSDESLDCNILDNINVARAPNAKLGNDWFTITTSHKASPAQETRGVGDVRAFYERVIEGLHLRNKEVLRSVLNSGARELIGLDGAHSS